MFKDLNQAWDMDVIFPGGSGSPQFVAFVDQLRADMKDVAAEVEGGAPAGADGWAARMDHIQKVARDSRHAGAFVSCLTAQNVADSHARIVGGQLREIQATFANILTRLDQQLLAVPEDEWRALLADERLASLSFNLDERRRRAKDLLPLEMETLVNGLSTDGYHGWSELYDVVTGRMTITLEDKEGKPVTVSPGQAANRMSNPDPKVRAEIMSRWEQAWAKEADLCALAINHIAGFRLNLYRQRGWDSVLHEPLDINRMTPETLDAMWGAVAGARGRLAAYLKRKQRLLGLEKMNWQDVDAPVGQSARRLTYDQAADFVVEQFGRFSLGMADVARRAFEERWIEAEDRPGKRMGGFCTGFPLNKVSRVFVTFSGSMGNVATVAHELGHAYHQSVMEGLPPFAQNYAMNVAETASTFAETVVFEAAIRNAADEKEKVLLLEDKLRRAVGLLMNIQARFLFETRFYEARKKGPVSVTRLNDIMVEAQKEAYAGALDSYHAHFWASKLHFYITRPPFYNFPYTFGYLFSAGVYARAMEVGPSFADRYVDLLRDTGSMRVEDLARKHLGADLTRPEFWEGAVDSVLGGLAAFLDSKALE